MVAAVETRWVVVSKSVYTLALYWVGFAATLVADPSEGYVGSQACAACHRGIYDSFRATAMGRSVTIASAEAQPDSAVISSSKLNREFRMIRQGARLYQIEAEHGAALVKDARRGALHSYATWRTSRFNGSQANVRARKGDDSRPRGG